MAGVPTNVPWEQKGLRRLSIGAGLGVAGGIAALVLPTAFLYLAAYDPGGLFGFTTQFVQTISIMVLAGGILFLLSLLLYRLSFSALRKVDARFWFASALCLVGTFGFLLLVVGAGLLVGDSAGLSSCLHGRPTQALSCVRSVQPLGGYTVLIGYWLAWLGGLGIVAGLLLSGFRYHRGWLYGGAIFYLLLLLVLVGPFLNLVLTIPYSGDLLLLAPLFVLIAPAAVFGGAGRALAASQAPPMRVVRTT
jgi:hypothetical protein